MKKKKVQKLTLKRETIQSLNMGEMSEGVAGGIDFTTDTQTFASCVGMTCVCTVLRCE